MARMARGGRPINGRPSSCACSQISFTPCVKAPLSRSTSTGPCLKGTSRSVSLPSHLLVLRQRQMLSNGGEVFVAMHAFLKIARLRPSRAKVHWVVDKLLSSHNIPHILFGWVKFLVSSKAFKIWLRKRRSRSRRNILRNGRQDHPILRKWRLQQDKIRSSSAPGPSTCKVCGNMEWVTLCNVPADESLL